MYEQEDNQFIMYAVEHLLDNIDMYHLGGKRTTSYRMISQYSKDLWTAFCKFKLKIMFLKLNLIDHIVATCQKVCLGNMSILEMQEKKMHIYQKVIMSRMLVTELEIM